MNESLAVIFDMDGLMIESEHRQSESLEHVLKHHGVEPEYNDSGLIQVVGITARDNLERLKREHAIETPLDELVEMKNLIYTRILDEGVEPQPGLVDLIAELKNNGAKIAVASGSNIPDIQKVLRHLELTDVFDAVVSGTEVEHGKPAPDIFIKVAELLGVSVSKCVVLEDAETGVKGGKAAGMKVVAVPSRYSKDNDFSEADLVVSTLEDLSYDGLKNLLA